MRELQQTAEPETSVLNSRQAGAQPDRHLSASNRPKRVGLTHAASAREAVGL
jgi:hypothetical protein